MTSETDDLRSLLNYLQTGSEEDPSESTEEYHKTAHLVEAVGQYELGDYSKEELVDIFAEYPIPNFDILAWIESKESQGLY